MPNELTTERIFRFDKKGCDKEIRKSIKGFIVACFIFIFLTIDLFFDSHIIMGVIMLLPLCLMFIVLCGEMKKFKSQKQYYDGLEVKIDEQKQTLSIKNTEQSMGQIVIEFSDIKNVLLSYANGKMPKRFFRRKKIEDILWSEEFCWEIIIQLKNGKQAFFSQFIPGLALYFWETKETQPFEVINLYTWYRIELGFNKRRKAFELEEDNEKTD